ncbi:MAG TPA: fluoride efflux transporter CrcB [Desulfobacterales bacterium]|nr:fluoride efflux transporter CrcB [Desulfobacterales bacterium]
MNKIALVMLGGGLGAVCRYLLGLAAAGLVGARFPLGTLAANMTGCLLIGMAVALSARSRFFPTPARLFLVTGFLGGLTTFSTYALETVIVSGSTGGFMAAANLALNNLGGLLLVLAGMGLVAAVCRRK